MTMLILLISLFSLHDLYNCVNYEKAKFDEFSLMKQHHQNVLQIKDFIKAAQHKFHEQGPMLRGGDNEHDATRDGESLDYSITNWWWGITSSIDQLGLSTPQTFHLPLIRSRPSFPLSITPYTTELNNRHLKWEEIFPDQNAYTRPYESKLSIGSKVSSTLKTPSLLQRPSKTMKPGPQNQKTFGPSFQPPKLHKSSRPLHPNTTSTSLNTSLRGHSDPPFRPTTTLITPNEEHKKIWLQEITTCTPVERCFKSLATQTVTDSTPSYDYTIKPTSQVESTLTKAQALVQSRQLKNDSKDQPPLILRQGISLSETPTEIDDYRYPTTSTATAKTAQSFIEDVGGILNLRTTLEKDEERTKMIDEITATVSNDEQHPDTRASPFRKSRRFHSKARARKRHHHSHRQHKGRQRFQKHRYRYPEYSNEDIYQRQQEEVEYRKWRKMRESTDDRKWFSINTPNQRLKTTKKVTRPTENWRPTDPPNAMLQFHSEDYDSEDEKLIKFIDRRAQKDKTSLYHQVKESLKQAESKQLAKRIKVKAELLRKIVEGSSYSDEEASLTKNLVKALQYGNRTIEHNVARNNRHDEMDYNMKFSPE